MDIRMNISKLKIMLIFVFVIIFTGCSKNITNEQPIQMAAPVTGDQIVYNVHACQDMKFNFLVMNSFREFYAAT